jgi:DNA repair protein RadA
MPKRKTDKQVFEEQQKNKDAVRGSLRKSEDYQKKLKKIVVSAVINPFAERESVERLLTGTALDRLLSRTGGVELGSTIELFGEFASGKTQICMALAAEASKYGRVIYIDSEHTFRGDRMLEICVERDIETSNIGDRLLLYTPEDWIEQEAATMNLPEFDSDGNYLDIRIVIVDSLMKHWAAASEFYGRENLTQRQQLVRAQMERLGAYARRHNAVFLFTNQVYDKPTDTLYAPPEEKVGSRGGKTVEHYADYRLFLRKGRGNMRFARLVDSPDIPLMEVPFILDGSGIADIPDPAERAKAVVMSQKYGDKFMSGQVHSVSAGLDHKKKAYELGYVTRDEAKNLGLSDKDIEKIDDSIAKSMAERLGDDLTLEERAILDSMDIVDYEDIDESEYPVIDFDNKTNIVEAAEEKEAEETEE